MAGDQFAQHIAKIGGQVEIAALVELRIVGEAGPIAVDLAALHIAAHHKHHVRVAVIGSPIAVLAHGAAELGHRHNGDIFHAIAQVLIKRRECLPEIQQVVVELARLVHMRIPSADLGKRHFHADIRFDQPGDLLQILTESSTRIFCAVGRCVALLLNRLHDLHGAEGLAAGAVENGVERMVVHAFERRRRLLIAHLKIVQVIHGDRVITAA